MKKGKKILITLLIVAALIVSAALLWFFYIKDALLLADASPVYVNSVAAITGMDTGAAPRYAGIVEPQVTHKIEKDESRTVSELHVNVGDQIVVGDPLFSYDTKEIELRLSEATLELENISNQITVLTDQKKVLTDEKKKATDDEQYAYTVQIQSVELQIKTQEYYKTLKNNEISEINASLVNSTVCSEVDGTVQEINVNPSTDAMGQPLPFISILSGGEHRVKGTVSELNRYNIAVGDEVVVYSRIDSSATWRGIIESIDFENPVSNNDIYYGGASQSSRYSFYISLADHSGLILGQHVYIEPYSQEGTQKEGLWLSAAYLCHDDAGSYVWAKSDRDTLEKRTVIIGEYDTENDKYQIKDGITVVDYIAYPDDEFMPGLPVTTDSAVAEPQNSAPPAADGGIAMPDVMETPSTDSDLTETYPEDTFEDSTLDETVTTMEDLAR